MILHVAGAAPRQSPDAAARIVVATAAILTYIPALANGFAYDDLPLIFGDPRVHELTGWQEILTRPYWPGAGHELALYRPLTTLSFALDWLLSGGWAPWFHATNIALHAAATLLALELLRRFFPLRAAAAGALLFAVHPVHSEAVINIAARSDLLAATLVLAACALWTRDGSARPRDGTTTCVTALYALALLAKESAVVLPALLALLDVARDSRAPGHASPIAYLRTRGLALATLVFPLAGYLALRLAVLDRTTPAIVHPAAEVLHQRADLLRTALLAWPEYLRLLLFPRTLLADYGPQILTPATTWTPRAALGLGLLAATTTAGTLAFARGLRRTGLALLWFPIAILPASNLIVTIGVPVAERTLYLPSLTLAFAAAGATTALRRIRTGTAGRAAILATGIALLAALAGRAWLRAPDWRSTETVFRALLRDRPDAYRAHWFLARLARANRQPALATAHYEHALRLWPHRERLVLEAAAYAVERGDLTRARQLAEAATHRWPYNPAGHRILAATALDLGDTTAAREAARAGLDIHPTDSLLRAIAEAAGRQPHGPRH